MRRQVVEHAGIVYKIVLAGHAVLDDILAAEIHRYVVLGGDGFGGIDGGLGNVQRRDGKALLCHVDGVAAFAAAEFEGGAYCFIFGKEGDEVFVGGFVLEDEGGGVFPRFVEVVPWDGGDEGVEEGEDGGVGGDGFHECLRRVRLWVGGEGLHFFL